MGASRALSKFNYNFKKDLVTVGMDTGKMDHMQWQEYRQSMKTLGGSEIGAVLGLDKYTSNVELFYKKIGLYQSDFGYRLPMAMGNMFEPIMRVALEFYDEDPSVFAENMDKKRKQHRVKNYKKTLHSKKYPFLHFHLDGLARWKGYEGTGSVELKWMSEFVADMWHNSLPPNYYAQGLIAVHALGLDYAVVSFFTGNHTSQTFIVEPNQDLFDSWVPILADFYNRCEKARQTIADAKKVNTSISNDTLYALVEQYEPEQYGEIKPYMDFMSERAKMLELENEIEADAEDHTILATISEIKAKTKDLKGDEDIIKAHFMEKMVKADAGKMTFGEIGSITYRQGARGMTMRFNLKKKVAS